jgi:hypothetical protein
MKGACAMKRSVYAITLAEAKKEYNRNGDFKEIVQSSLFIYIEGMYVIDNPKYILRKGSNPPTLTPYAWDNLRECALAFIENTPTIPPGLHDEGENKFGSKPPRDGSKNYNFENQKQELTKEIEDLRKVAYNRFDKLRDQKKTCWQRIGEILGKEEVTPKIFQSKTLLNRRFYTKPNEYKNAPPKFHTIVSIAAGFNLDLGLTEELLKLAGHAFSPVIPEHDALIFIIVSMSEYDIDAKNEMLEKEKFTKLGSRENKRKGE